MISSIGKALVIAGLSLAAVGALVLLAGRLDSVRELLARFPLGRLPGDVNLHREGFSFSFPWVTCLVISIAASVVLSFFRK